MDEKLDNTGDMDYNEPNVVEPPAIDDSPEESQLEPQLEATEDTATEEVSEIDSVEEEASSRGWNPDKGDLTPKEFIERGSFFKKINSLKQNNKQLEKRLVDLTELMLDQNKRKNSDDRSYLEGVVSGSDDPDEIRNAVKALSTLEIDEKHLEKYTPPTESNQQTDPEIKEFLMSHPDWFPNAYNANVKLTQKQQNIQQFATKRELDIKAQNPYLDQQDVLDIIEDEIVTKFENPTTRVSKTVNRPSTVKPSSSKGAKSPRDVNSLSAFDKSMYKKLVTTGMVDKETFFKSIEQNREK